MERMHIEEGLPIEFEKQGSLTHSVRSRRHSCRDGYGHAPLAHFNLGLPAPARGVTEPPDASVALPSTAILGWRSRDQLKGRP